MIKFLFYSLGSLVFLVSCSLSLEEPNGGFALFSSDSLTAPIPSSEFSKADDYLYTCVTLRGPNGFWGSEIRRMKIDSDSLEVEFQLPKVQVGMRFAIRLIGFKDDPALQNEKWRCPISNPSGVAWATLGVADFTASSTSELVVLNYRFEEYPLSRKNLE